MAAPINANAVSQTAVILDNGSTVSGRQSTAADGKGLPLEQRPAEIEPVDIGVSRETLMEAAQDLESYLQGVDRALRISVDESSGDTVIKVFDQSTDELVRQIPSEEVLALARFMAEQSAEQEPSARGLLLDNQA